jgi:archaemetzincin
VKLFAVISGLVLAAVLLLLFVFSHSGAHNAGDPSFSIETVPAEPVIEIMPVGEVEQADLELVAAAVSGTFKLRTITSGAMALPNAALDETRCQYNADWMLRVADALRSEGAFRTMLVTAADIYSGSLPYVLSMCSGDRRMTVISTARLARRDRIEYPLETVRTRIRRLAVRAVAYTLGVGPCHNDCVLAGRVSIENLDKGPDYFCPECATALQDTLSTDIGSPHEHFKAALLYLQDDSLDGAIKEFKKAIELKRDYLAAYLNLGELYLRKGWHAEAIQTLRAAEAVAPQDVEPRTRLAQVLLLGDQPASALEELHGALAIDPGSREVYRLLGITYQFYCGDAERARAHYRKFIELGGDPEIVRELLELLGGPSGGGQ